MPDAGIADGSVLTSAIYDTYVRQQVAAQVTSGTRPTGVEGRLITETDTDRLLAYDGAAWVRMGAWSSAGRTGATLTRAATQSIGTAAETAVSWDTEATDTDAFIAVPATTVTIPTGLGGIYAVSCWVSWATNPGANSAVRLELGGQSYRSHCGTGTWAFPQQATAATVPLAATNTIIVYAYQATGASINITARLELWRIHG